MPPDLTRADLARLPIRADDVLLRCKDVQRRTNLSVSAIYRRMALGTFPRPLQLGGGIVRWPESWVVAWVQSLSTDGEPPAAPPPAGAPASSGRPIPGR